MFGTGGPGASGSRSFSDRGLVDFLKLLDEDLKDHKDNDKTASPCSDQDEDLEDHKERR